MPDVIPLKVGTEPALIEQFTEGDTIPIGYLVPSTTTVCSPGPMPLRLQADIIPTPGLGTPVPSPIDNKSVIVDFDGGLLIWTGNLDVNGNDLEVALKCDAPFWKMRVKWNGTLVTDWDPCSFPVGTFSYARGRSIRNLPDTPPWDVEITFLPGFAPSEASSSSLVVHKAGPETITGVKTIQPLADAQVGLIVSGHSATQSANLQQWTNSSGVVKTAINSLGRLITPIGSNNLFVGNNQAGVNLTSGQFNVFLGSTMGLSLTSGSSNVVIGYTAGNAITTGSSNCCIGNAAGTSILTGNNNFCLGSGAGQAVVSGSSNVYIGTNAGISATGSLSVAIGTSAFASLTSANRNVGIGGGVGSANTAGAVALVDGGNNTLIGDNAGVTASNASGAVAIGRNALSATNGLALGTLAVALANECALGPNINVVTNYVLDSTSTLVQRWDWTAANVSNIHGTRKYRIIGNVWDTAAREWIRAEADGAAAKIGFLGAAAIARQTLNAAASDPATTMALVNQIRQLLIDFGFAQ